MEVNQLPPSKPMNGMPGVLFLPGIMISAFVATVLFETSVSYH